MTRRLRLLHVVVQPVAVWDDGESLDAGPALRQFTVPLSDLDNFPTRLREGFEAVRQQLAEEAAVAALQEQYDAPPADQPVT